MAITQVDYYFWKDKNKLCICQGTKKDKDRFMFIDVNDFSIHGLSGRKVKSCPSGFAFALRCDNWWGDKQYIRHYEDYSVEILKMAVMNTLEDNYSRDTKAQIFPQLEKIVNALAPHGYYIRHLPWAWHATIEQISDDMKESGIKFKDILDKLARDTEENVHYIQPFDNGYAVTFYDLIKIVNALTAAKRYQKYARHFEVLGEESAIYVIEAFQRYDWWNEYSSVIWEWLEHPQTLAILHLGVVALSSLVNAIERAIKHAIILERKPEKGIPFFQWEVLERDYNSVRDEIANETLAKTQLPSFAFEDDNYIAIVPTTVLEFTNEGAAMGNCIGGIWLNGSYGNNPYEGKMERGAVFIRRKSAIDKPFVDCDFMLSSGDIRQCYGKSNSQIYDDTFEAFRNALQKHLYDVCKK